MMHANLQLIFAPRIGGLFHDSYLKFYGFIQHITQTKIGSISIKKMNRIIISNGSFTIDKQLIIK